MVLTIACKKAWQFQQLYLLERPFPIFRRMILTWEHESELASGLVKTQIAGPLPQSFWYGSFGIGPRICISSKFPEEADATGSSPMLWKLLVFKKIVWYFPLSPPHSQSLWGKGKVPKSKTHIHTHTCHTHTSHSYTYHICTTLSYTLIHLPTHSHQHSHTPPHTLIPTRAYTLLVSLALSSVTTQDEPLLCGTA